MYIIFVINLNKTLKFVVGDFFHAMMKLFTILNEDGSRERSWTCEKNFNATHVPLGYLIRYIYFNLYC
jgi:hypothetical protein